MQVLRKEWITSATLAHRPDGMNPGDRSARRPARRSGSGDHARRPSPSRAPRLLSRSVQPRPRRRAEPAPRDEHGDTTVAVLPMSVPAPTCFLRSRTVRFQKNNSTMPSRPATPNATRFQGDGRKRSNAKATMISIEPGNRRLSQIASPSPSSMTASSFLERAPLLRVLSPADLPCSVCSARRSGPSRRRSRARAGLRSHRPGHAGE